jgi:proton-dependent oligopeptide transporter, POT family
VYAFTFIGGVFADKILGFQKSLFWGALLMIVGGFIIAVQSPGGTVLHRHLLLHHRHGLLQAQHQHHGGQLYHTNDSRRDAGFGLFYAGINIGALLGGT